MGKYKVRAETKEQSDEIQKLANSIGIFRNYNNWVLHKGWVCLDGNEILLVCDSCPGGEEDFKTITLSELRAMVNPMREYLDKQEDGTYKLITASSGCADRDLIEIPEGAIRARFYPHDPDELEFENSNHQWWHGENKEWTYYTDYAGSVEYSRVVWRRTPSLNDQHAEIEQVRQASKDNVSNPQHYNKGGVECIDAIEASMTHEAFKGYLKGNVQKYMWRYEQKGGVESLRKAQWYLERLIASMDS